MTVATRKFVPPASITMTGLFLGIFRSISRYVGSMARELSAPGQTPVHLLQEALAGLLDADVPVIHALLAEEVIDPAS